MILIDLNQLLKKIVIEVANENDVTLDEKIIEQVEFCLLYTSDAADDC